MPQHLCSHPSCHYRIYTRATHGLLTLSPVFHVSRSQCCLSQTPWPSTVSINTTYVWRASAPSSQVPAVGWLCSEARHTLHSGSGSTSRLSTTSRKWLNTGTELQRLDANEEKATNLQQKKKLSFFPGYCNKITETAQLLTLKAESLRSPGFAPFEY